MKVCTKCGISKVKTSFYNCKSKKDGLHSNCKSCDNAYASKYSKLKKSVEYRKEYEKNRRKSDPNFKIAKMLRKRIYQALKGNSKRGSAVRDLGCTIPELKIYLENRFEEGMTWDNHGKWHIDHKIPLASFNLSDREQFLQATTYTNLQPLWAIDNQSKGRKLP